MFLNWKKSMIQLLTKKLKRKLFLTLIISLIMNWEEKYGGRIGLFRNPGVLFWKSDDQKYSEIHP